MNWRSVTLRTRDNQHYFLPNATIAKQEIVNFTRPSPLQRLRMTVGLAYRHPPSRVKEALARAATGLEGVNAAPAPEVVVTDYGDFAIQYEMRFWIADYARLEQIQDAVLTRVWYELRRADLVIPFPIRDVNVHTVPEDYEARAAERERRELFAVLRPLPLFAPLSDAQIEQLVRGAALQRYTAGEVLVRQGADGDSLFVVKSGQVHVDRAESGQVMTVATIGPDEFFGEMSLLTGEPRTASVIAQVETEVVEVDKPDLAAVIAADANVLESLTLALEARMRHSAEHLAAATDLLKDKSAPQHAALLGRIRRFFSIKA
jgi:CRP-like cAMP-binding protein